jgi:hypothetical protein
MANRQRLRSAQSCSRGREVEGWLLVTGHAVKTKFYQLSMVNQLTTQDMLNSFDGLIKPRFEIRKCDMKFPE